MSWRVSEGGSAAAIVVVLLPLLATIVAGTIQLAALRVIAGRAQAAADLAALVAVDDQDDAALARSGELYAAADAEAVARDTLARNLAPLAGLLDATPEAIAAAALVEVRDHPARVIVTAAVPARTPLFAVLLRRPVSMLAIHAVSAAR